MHLKYRLHFVILATVALTVCRLHAQDDDEDDDEFATGMYTRAPQSITMALNLTRGPKVNFGNLGNLPVAVDQSGVGNRIYNDGQVNKDDLRQGNTVSSAQNETDLNNGHPVDVINGRYYTYSTPNDPSTPIVTDYLAYQKGLTRSWSYNNASQALPKPGYIAFDIYSAHTNGEGAIGSRGYTGGVELAVAHHLADFKKRFSLRLTASVTLTGINSSNIGDVNSSLQTYTDYYRYHLYGSGVGAPASPLNSDGTVPTPYYSGPSYDSTTISGRTTETTSTASDTPDAHDDNTSVGQNVVVHGIWKIKGAYFTIKIGPEVSAMLTRNLGVKAGIGLAGSYVGTTYSANESFTVAGVADPLTPGEQSSSTSRALPGYYANIDATWAINDRSGMFAGFSYDNLGEYNQGLANTGRTAKIDLSASAGVRGGLSIKF